VRSPLERVSAAAITDAVTSGWELRFDEFRYLPEGGGAYHWVGRAGATRWFVTCDDLDTKPWLGTDRNTVFERLSAAYAATMALREAGADFVVAPMASATGAPAERVDERHCVSVLAYIDGSPGRWGESLANDECEQLVTMLARLHASATTGPPVISREVDIPGRQSLELALDELAIPWDAGPLSVDTRDALTTHARGLTEALEEFDRLASNVGALEPCMALTHGEPHPGNLIRSAGDLLLVDWDTIAVARPERDLWMLAEVDVALLDRYRDLTGIAADSNALRAFRLVWALSDLAIFTAQLRGEHGGGADDQRALAGLRSILAGHEPRPYGAAR